MQKRSKNLLLMLPALFLALSMPACKQQKHNASSEKTVDDIDQGVDDTVNSEEINQHCSSKKEPDAIVKDILNNLPERLHQEFEDVQIVYHTTIDEVNSTCRSANNDRIKKSQQGRKFVACWVPDSATDFKTARPIIHLLKDGAVVQNNLIAMVLYSYSELFIDQKMKNVLDKVAADHRFRQGTEQFMKQRKILSEAVIKHLTAKSPSVLEKYEGDFDSTDNLADSVDFQNFVLAEVSESAYCSDDTRKELASETYKPVRDAFKPLDDFFKQNPKD